MYILCIHKLVSLCGILYFCINKIGFSYKKVVLFHYINPFLVNPLQIKLTQAQCRMTTHSKYSVLFIGTSKTALKDILEVKLRTNIGPNKRSSEHTLVVNARTMSSCSTTMSVSSDDHCVHCGSARGCLVNYYQQWDKK